MRRKIGGVLISVGVLIMIGTAGASDAEVYTLWETALWIMRGTVIALIGAGFLAYGG